MAYSQGSVVQLTVTMSRFELFAPKMLLRITGYFQLSDGSELAFLGVSQVMVVDSLVLVLAVANPSVIVSEIIVQSGQTL